MASDSLRLAILINTNHRSYCLNKKWPRPTKPSIYLQLVRLRFKLVLKCFSFLSTRRSACTIEIIKIFAMRTPCGTVWDRNLQQKHPNAQAGWLESLMFQTILSKKKKLKSLVLLAFLDKWTQVIKKPISSCSWASVKSWLKRRSPAAGASTK